MKKEHNIFTYAKKELGQDAFIAMLCALNDSENIYEKELSRNFIKFLFEDGQVPKYDKVEVQTQYCNIDVLLTFYENNNPIHYLIIEDKTDSEEHDGQIQRYINKIRYGKNYKAGTINKVLVNLNKISVVYYKTGHLLKSDSNLADTYDKNKQPNKTTRWRFDHKDSEQDRLTLIAGNNKDLRSFKILELPCIYNFFWKNTEYIYRSQNDILIGYFENLRIQFTTYEAGNLPEDAPTAAIWGRVFDEFVSEYKYHHNNTNMRFAVYNYSGQYWELSMSSIFYKWANNYSTNPVMLYNSRDFNKIRFVNKENTSPQLQKKYTNSPNPSQKHNDNIFSHEFNPSISKPITKDLINKLLYAIVEKYENILNNNQGPFAIDIKTILS